MEFTRRTFLEGSLASLGLLLVPRATAWAAPGAGTDRVLVVIFQRGAADGLNLVVPHGDADYYAKRPNNRVAPGSELDLDGFFGLHPGLSDLLPLYQDGRLAAIHAAGSPHPTRSHFEGQDFMELAELGGTGTGGGWLNRALAALDPAELHAGITLDNGASLSLRGSHANVAFSSIEAFDLVGARSAERQRALHGMYAAGGGPLLGPAVSTALDTVDLIHQVDRSTAVTYPSWTPALRLRDAAALIRADIGVRIVTLDIGGWDTHANEVVELAALLPRFGAALAAFQADLGAHAGRTLCLCMTEFGRTAAENEAIGSEHGHGSVMLALGAPVAGGRVVLANDVWPGLDGASLHQGRDLAVTTDFRDVFAEVLDRHLGVANPDAVLPDFVSSPARYPGILL